jgi:hypothetical protein
MALTLYATGTEYTANAITLRRGSVADILSVGVYHTTDPDVVPAVGDFQTVTLVMQPNPLADGNNVDILSLVGAEGDVILGPGTYQRWCLVTTATERIIRRVDTIVVQGEVGG